MWCVHISIEETYHNFIHRRDIPKLSLFSLRPGAMIKPQWLEQPLYRTDFHGPKDVGTILYGGLVEN